MLIKPGDVQKVGNLFIDSVHEEEIRLINELYEALTKEDKSKADELMDELLVDLEDHFTTEEELMREFEFFAYPMHKAEHDQMRQRFKEVYDAWKKDRNCAAVVSFLKDEFVPWIKSHVARWDSTTAQHLGD
ncbi:MAG: bacteriohemerythrin [Aquificae bacterium]|nr:bacteriohemerythrin [Aquificota bacterium]